MTQIECAVISVVFGIGIGVLLMLLALGRKPEGQHTGPPPSDAIAGRTEPVVLEEKGQTVVIRGIASVRDIRIEMGQWLLRRRGIEFKGGSAEVTVMINRTDEGKVIDARVEIVVPVDEIKYCPPQK